ncbi:DUF1758 domain-containing protein [Trichonephila clavipes]|uniref:DUF1758 domain-containing protein n=1 Tax=Trichonephila clavipes TaxID=2585209 RepID=A0A8X6R5M9_TRICX|nr:DUF1758 domain-containing protein [Trichonephila clavipes]
MYAHPAESIRETWNPPKVSSPGFDNDFKMMVRISSQPDSHRTFIRRVLGTSYHQENIIERHRCGGAGLLIWERGRIILGSRTDLHDQIGTMKGQIYRDVILEEHTFWAIVNAKLKGSVQLRCMLDGGANKSFILREVVELLYLKVVDKEALVIYTFGSEVAVKCSYDIVEVTLQNLQTNKQIKIQAVVIDSITSARIRISSQFVRNIALERGLELADNSTSERIDVLIGSDYISEILGERNIRISKILIAVDSIFGYLIQGKEDEVINCKDIIANHLIVENVEFDFDRVKNLWSLETIEINPDNEVPLSDKEILKSFERNTVYTNKRYEIRLLWMEDSRELKSNYEIEQNVVY